MKLGSRILNVLVSASVALLWLGIAVNVFGYHINELHYFSGIAIFVIAGKIWDRAQLRLQYAVGAAVVALSLLAYPMLTAGPRRERRRDRELVQKMAVEKETKSGVGNSTDTK